jgi:hypothetical protein
MLVPADEPMRIVQEADVAGARQRLARRLGMCFPWRDELVPEAERYAVLKFAVSELFQAMCEVIDECAPRGLLEDLIARNERTIAENEHRRRTLASRIAGYPASAQHLRDEVARANQAAVAGRFLVEYVAAQPRTGSAPWSLSRFDAAMARGAELTAWANMSSAIYAQLSDLALD